MNPADRKKIMLAGGVALAAILVIAFFVLRGRGGRGQAGPATGFQEMEATATETGGAAGPRTPGGAGGAATEEAAAGGGTGASAAAVEAASKPGPMVGQVQMGIGPAEPTRVDPFLTFEPPPQPTPPELLVGLPMVGVVPGGLRPGGGATTVARVGKRRVAGLLFNDQAWAILENDDGETFIVKPGDVVDGIRITAIARDSLFLRDSDGRRWQVLLRGASPGSRAGTTVSGMPETPPA
jgi:hypothetical protein